MTITVIAVAAVTVLPALGISALCLLRLRKSVPLITNRVAVSILLSTTSSLERNRDKLQQLLIDNIHADPAIRRWRHLPFHEALVRATAETSYRILLQTMTDPRTAELVAHMLRENMTAARARLLRSRLDIG
jgi:cell division protein FtsX